MTSGWYILGAEVDAFEHEFAAYCGVRNCVALANGLDALHLILRACGIGPDDEVIVPSNTYIASWLAVSQAGAIPVPVEPVLDTSNLDPDLVEAAITSRTRAIMPVHLYGQPAETAPLMEIARRRGLKVVEDAAQAHGAAQRGVRAGALGHAAAWSFYPGKNLGAFGDAGGVTTDDDELADQLRVLRNYGSRVKYFNEVAGYNSRLDPLQAAFLRVRLQHLDEWNSRRRRMAERYAAELSGLPGITLPHVAVATSPAWHLFVIRCRRRDALQSYLHSKGIGTLIHYPVPPHRSGAYAGSAAALGSYPRADELADTVLSLPIGPHMTDGQQSAVIGAVRAWASESGFG
jgi:dTDP-4-amino-4,6-dideoxygalactose transaminase